MTKDEQIEILEHDIRNADDRIEELESEISDLEDKVAELEEELDECESPTFGMSISQVSCYEVFIDILKRLPKSAHEIEEELI